MGLWLGLMLAFDSTPIFRVSSVAFRILRISTTAKFPGSGGMWNAAGNLGNITYHTISCAVITIIAPHAKFYYRIAETVHQQVIFMQWIRPAFEYKTHRRRDLLSDSKPACQTELTLCVQERPFPLARTVKNH